MTAANRPFSSTSREGHHLDAPADHAGTGAESASPANSRTDQELAVNQRIGKRIRMRRIMLGYTQDVLAREIRVSPQQLHKYETGTNRVTPFTLIELSQLLGTTLDHLLLEDGDDGASLCRRDIGPGALELLRHYNGLPTEQQHQVLDVVRRLADSAER